MLRALYDIDRARFVFAFQGNPADFASVMQQLGWNDGAEIDRWMVEDGRETAQLGIKFLPCVAKQKNPFKSGGQAD